MRRIPNDVWSTIISVGYLGLMTNLMLLLACSPVVVLLMITDPALSWPLLGAVAPVCAPALPAAFAAFRAHGRGEGGVVRPFIAGWRATWRKSMLVGLVLAAFVVVLLVDVRMLSPLQAGVVVIPMLGVLAALALATGLVALVAISEAPTARLRDVLKASLYLGARRWYLTAVSMIVLATQLMLFASMPALAIGLSAAPALYLAWANSRYTLRPVLDTDEATAS